MRSEQLISKKTLVMSVVFHLLVAFSFSIAWPFIASPPTTAQPLVIVNMVDRVPETNLEAAKSKAPKASDVEQEATKKRPPLPPPPPPPPPPKPAPKVKPPEKPVKAPVPDAEILPDKQVKPPKAKPVSAPAARPVPPKLAEPPKQRPQQPRTVSIDAPPARPNKLIKKSQQKQKAQALSGVLQNLADVSKTKKADKNQKAKQKQKARDNLANTLAQAAAENTPNEQEQRDLRLGLSDLDRLRAHISQCWSPPIGAKGADNLKVDILLELERDGTVKRAEIQNTNRFNQDKTYKVAAEAALRAVIGCGKLPLPPEKYDFWKTFIFGFDPKNM